MWRQFHYQLSEGYILWIYYLWPPCTPSHPRQTWVVDPIFLNILDLLHMDAVGLETCLYRHVLLLIVNRKWFKKLCVVLCLSSKNATWMSMWRHWSCERTHRFVSRGSWLALYFPTNVLVCRNFLLVRRCCVINRSVTKSQVMSNDKLICYCKCAWFMTLD